MGMQTDLSVPSGLARLAPHNFLACLVSGSGFWYKLNYMIVCGRHSIDVLISCVGSQCTENYKLRRRWKVGRECITFTVLTSCSWSKEKEGKQRHLVSSRGRPLLYMRRVARPEREARIRKMSFSHSRQSSQWPLSLCISTP